MQSVNKELKNIPISVSVLHEQEYNNLLHKLKKNKRRAHSDKSKNNDIVHKSLKN